MKTRFLSLSSFRAAALCMSLLLGIVACGDDEPSTPDLCSGVTCEAGVCDEGLCVNAADCSSGDDLCLGGYSCNAGTCEADIPCDETANPCANGVCQAGACVNPGACQTNANCLSGFFCDDGTCQPDSCAEVTCDRGVCEIGTGECVNEDFCTTATEAEACLDDFRCVGGACQDEATFCAELDCQRGVCSFEDLACADAANCDGSDMNCLDGNYCADDGSCQPNLCDANGDCARGVCDPASGECVNSDTCASEDDCIDGVVCISGACTPQEEACGVDGCAGNQLCSYDDANLSAACEENAAEGCTAALDCLDERVCAEGACADPSACTPDAYEPNDAAGEEVEYTSVNGGLPFGANICSTDVDRFTFDTTTDPDGDGTLIFSVTIDDTDVGLGTLGIELFDVDGNPVGDAVTQDAMGNPTNSATVEVMVQTGTNSGVYTGVVSDDGDVTTAGVNYSVRFDVVSGDAVAACDMPTTLTAGTPATGDSSTGASSSLSSSCGDIDGTVSENIWQFTLAEESLVNLVVSPLSNDPDLTVSIRQVCAQDESEVAGGCSDNSGAGSNENIETVLPAGTYFAVVQGDVDGDGGPYAITLNTTATICAAGEQTCLDASDLEFCNDTQTAFETRTCQNGCDQTADICIPDQGDTCGSAFVVDENNPFVRELDRDNFRNTYDIGDVACLPNNQGSQSTEGPDIVLTALVPDGYNFGVRVSGAFDDDSIYFVTDCADLASTCVGGANAQASSTSSGEFALFENDTGQDVTIFAIVDVADERFLSTPDIEARVAPRICTSGDRRCVLDRESQICNDFGTAYDQTEICANGCDIDGSCLIGENDLCSAATAVPNTGGTFSGELGTYTNTETDRGECKKQDGSTGISQFDGNTNEAFYVVSVTQANSLITADLVTGANLDGVIWVTDSCDMDVAGTCLAGVDDSDSDGDPETLQYLAPAPGDYYFVVEGGDGSTATGSFDVTFTIQDPQCPAGDLLRCGTSGSDLVFCNAQGQEETLTCTDGCTSASGVPRCGTPTGNVCPDPFVIDTSSGSGIFDDVPFGSSNDFETGSGTFGSCYVGTSYDEGDSVYEVSLQAGETLVADFVSAESSSTMFLLRECGDFNTCFGNFDDEGVVSIEYYAETSETVYLVVDHSVATTETYDLNWSINLNNSCSPGSTVCLDPNTALACSEDGQTRTTYSCTCSDDRCQLDTAVGASCTNPATGLAPGSYFYDNEENRGATDEFDSFLSCAGDSPFGQDYYFELTIPADNILVFESSAPNPSDDVVTYVFTDCADISGTCVAGAGDDNSASFTYQAGAIDEVVIVGVDSGSSSDDDGIYFAFDILPPECSDGAPTICNADDNLAVCSSGLFEEVATCSGGCTNGRCGVPTGQLCSDSQVVDTSTATSGTVTGDWTNFVDTIAVPEQFGRCTGVYPAGNLPDGPDAWYQFDLDANELLVIDLNAVPAGESETWERIGFFFDDCSGAETACAAGLFSDNGEAATGAYFAEQAGTVYFVLDSEEQPSLDAFTFDWTITTGAVCQPGAVTCSNTTTREECNSDGTMVIQTTCENSCVDGVCVPTPADPATDDLCDQMPLLTASASFAGNWNNFTNAIDPLGACNTGSDGDGEEAIYAVEVQAGSLLTVTLADDDTDPDQKPYIFTDCDDVGGSCLAGDQSFTATPATAEYYNDSGQVQVVYVAADHDEPGTGANFQLDIDLRNSDCDPATYTPMCNMGETATVTCDTRGFTQEFSCTSGCDTSTGLCIDAEGEVCTDAIAATPAALSAPETFTGTLGDFTEDYDLGTGNSCTGSRTVGPDAVYAVELTAGQTLNVDLESVGLEDLAVYATTGGCEEDLDVRDTCVAGSDSIGVPTGPTDLESFTHVASTDQVVYVYVDSFFSSVSGDYNLTIEVTP